MVFGNVVEFCLPSLPEAASSHESSSHRVALLGEW